MLLILETMLEHFGEARHQEFAVKLLHWADKGFPELGGTNDQYECS
jgi:hypothetical protein